MAASQGAQADASPEGESRSLRIAGRGSGWWDNSLHGKLQGKDLKGQRGDAWHGLVTSGGRGLEREHGGEQERGFVRKRDYKEQWGGREGAELGPGEQCAQWKSGRARAKEGIAWVNAEGETGI